MRIHYGKLMAERINIMKYCSADVKRLLGFDESELAKGEKIMKRKR